MSDRDPFEDDDPFEDVADAKTQASAAAEQYNQKMAAADRAERQGRKKQAALLRAEAEALLHPAVQPGGNGKQTDEELKVDLQPVRDLGHATVLAELLAERYRWAEHRGTWMRWTGSVWEPISEPCMVTASTEALRKRYGVQIAQTKGDKDEIRRLAALVNETCIYSRMIGALSFLKGMPGFHTAAGEWDPDPWVLNVKNGELDLRTGELRPHDPRHLHTMIAGVDYVPGAELAAWTAHLERFLPNENVRRQVQRDLGVALVGGTLQERLPIWYGTGGNGKTTTERIVQRVCSDYVRVAAPNLLIQSKYERHPTEIADLAGSRVVFSVEIGGGRKLDEARVKELTGGDTKKGRFMHQDYFEFPQTFSIFLLVNHRPRIADSDEGIWRRVALVPWQETIPEDQRRGQDEVVDELTGPWVLAWLVAGLLDWQKDRAWVAPEVIEATAAYRQEEDRFSGFLEERCEMSPLYWTPSGDLYAAYEAWCRDNDTEPAGKRALAARLSEAGCDPKTGHGKLRGWRGIRVKSAFRKAENAGFADRGADGGGSTMSPLRENPVGAAMGEPPPNAPHDDLWEGTDLSGPPQEGQDDSLF